jgi:D-arabinose 1-dehydrogenase-like Zn-dependent alcohol dehydrogenase
VKAVRFDRHGPVDVPIAAAFPLAQVREAYELLAKDHIRGKIVLLP